MSDATSLRGLQEWMQNALIHPQLVTRDEVTERLVPSNRLSASERLAIYQRSYIARLCICLAEQFPASRHALGPELFDNFARVYLGQDPSDSYTLYELGRRFPAFLAETRPDKEDPEDWVNFMIDLATYERSLFVLFDAPGHEGKSWPTEATPDENLVLQPCFDLGAYRFPVATYYHNVTDKSAPELPPKGESYVAMTRFNFLTSSFPITAVQYAFLRAMRDYGSVKASLEQVAELNGIETAQARHAWETEIRAAWIANHFFVDRGMV